MVQKDPILDPESNTIADIIFEKEID